MTIARTLTTNTITMSPLVRTKITVIMAIKAITRTWC